jgi:hypothetical protein
MFDPNLANMTSFTNLEGVQSIERLMATFLLTLKDVCCKLCWLKQERFGGRYRLKFKYRVVILETQEDVYIQSHY